MSCASAAFYKAPDAAATIAFPGFLPTNPDPYYDIKEV
jgi:hypothetical protein